MNIEQEIIFGARHVVERLSQKHNYTFDTQKVVAWAQKCSETHGQISRDPSWWIACAMRDDECLAACLEMLRK